MINDDNVTVRQGDSRLQGLKTQLRELQERYDSETDTDLRNELALQMMMCRNAIDHRERLRDGRNGVTLEGLGRSSEE